MKLLNMALCFLLCLAFVFGTAVKSQQGTAAITPEELNSARQWQAYLYKKVYEAFQDLPEDMTIAELKSEMEAYSTVSGYPVNQ